MTEGMIVRFPFFVLVASVALCLISVPVAAVYLERVDADVNVENTDISPYPKYVGIVAELQPLDVSDDQYADIFLTLRNALARGRGYTADEVSLLSVSRGRLHYRIPTTNVHRRQRLRRIGFGFAYDVSAEITAFGSTKTVHASLVCDRYRNTFVTSYFTGARDQEEGDSKNGDGKKTFRVASYNIWNYNGDWKRRLRLLGREICSQEYDAVVVQEVRYGKWRDERLDANGWNWTLGRSQAEHIALECLRRGVQMEYVWQPAMTYIDHFSIDEEVEIEGVAVFTKHHIVQHKTRFLTRDANDQADYHQRVALAALVETDTEPRQRMAVVSSHWSLSPIMAIQNAEEASQLAEEVRSTWEDVSGVILAGDFNSDPDSLAINKLMDDENQLHDAWIESREMDSSEAMADLVDEETKKNKDGFSWCQTPGGENVKRCDYIFYRAADKYTFSPYLFSVPPKTPCKKNSVGDEVCASDHSPLAVSFLIDKKPHKKMEQTAEAAETPIKDEL